MQAFEIYKTVCAFDRWIKPLKLKNINKNPIKIIIKKSICFGN